MVIACCAYDIIRLPDQETKKHDWGERGAIIRGASPAASLPPRYWCELSVESLGLSEVRSMHAGKKREKKKGLDVPGKRVSGIEV